MISKFIVLWRAILGYCYKWLVDLKILRIPTLKDSCKTDNRIIVSMTSYGRRIATSVVYYSLVSALSIPILAAPKPSTPVKISVGAPPSTKSRFLS